MVGANGGPQRGVVLGRLRRSVYRLSASPRRIVTDRTDTRTGWLAPDELAAARDRLPIVYVDAVPVRINTVGEVTHVGLLLRAAPDGTISRAVVSGRVLYGERVRDALLRNLEKDLGPVALPRLPLEPQPFTVAEYFPDPTVSGYHDPRQHAVSLAFVVAVDGDCAPSHDSLDLTWVTPAEAVSAEVRREMTGGHDRLVRLALGHVGQLP
jgi:ADP-ribose pyrophosphatase YjhB (NUDIX family)